MRLETPAECRRIYLRIPFVVCGVVRYLTWREYNATVMPLINLLGLVDDVV